MVKPLPLHEHLHEVDQVYSVDQGTLMRRYVDHPLKDTDGLVEDRLGISDEISDGERAPIEVSLKQ